MYRPSSPAAYPNKSNSTTKFLQGSRDNGVNSIEVAYSYYYVSKRLDSSTSIGIANYKIPFMWRPVDRYFTAYYSDNLTSLDGYGSNGHGFTNYVDYSY